MFIKAFSIHVLFNIVNIMMFIYIVWMKLLNFYLWFNIIIYRKI